MSLHGLVALAILVTLPLVAVVTYARALLKRSAAKRRTKP